MALPPRIARQRTAKSAVKQVHKRDRAARPHVELVKLLPCAVCGRPGPGDAHHLMRGVERGMGLTAAGRYTIPLCRAHHDEAQRHGDPEAVLMKRHGVDARALAEALWAVSGDIGAMQRVAFRAHQESAQRRAAA